MTLSERAKGELSFQLLRARNGPRALPGGIGSRAQAAGKYRAAIELAPSDAERRFLTRRLEEVTAVH